MTRTDRATIEPLDLLARRLAGVLRTAVPPALAGPPVADVRSHAAGEHLTTLPGLRFILAGWVADYVALADGRRQIIALRLPGDFAGPLEPGVETTFLTMARTIDGTALSRLRVESPGARPMSVAELLDGEEQVRLRQLVVRLGRCSAYERTAHLLLDLHERLLPVGLARPDGFHLPLTQEVLADALGLSIVHVNRTLQQLRREGRLVLRGAQAVFPDRDALAADVHYTSRGPAPEARGDAGARMNADRQPLAGRRILVVEDEYFIADEVARSLNQAGAEVMGPCPTTERATLVLEGEGYRLDAAVLDLHLAGKSSLGLIRALQEQHVPVLLATGYDSAAIHPELQALPRCEKPINLTSLVGALERLLG